MIRRPISVGLNHLLGGGNIIDKIKHCKRIGADSNKYLIEALISIRDYIDELPKNNTEFTEFDYQKIRFSDNYKHKGYAGFALSYGGKWLGGWCRDSEKKRDYVKEAYNNALAQSKNIQGVELLVKNYRDLVIPRKSFIYCDPPYAGATSYRDKFNHAEFWDWCREQVKNGHTVYISEYSAPEDFECIWSKEICSSLTKQTGSKMGIERLFKYKNK